MSSTKHCVCVCVCVQVLHALEGVGVVVLAEFRFAFLLERGAVAGGLGVHPVFGQPGNYEVPSGFTRFLPPLQYLSVYALLSKAILALFRRPIV